MLDPDMHNRVQRYFEMAFHDPEGAVIDAFVGAISARKLVEDPRTHPTELGGGQIFLPRFVVCVAQQLYLFRRNRHRVGALTLEPSLERVEVILAELPHNIPPSMPRKMTHS